MKRRMFLWSPLAGIAAAMGLRSAKAETPLVVLPAQTPDSRLLARYQEGDRLSAARMNALIDEVNDLKLQVVQLEAFLTGRSPMLVRGQAALKSSYLRNNLLCSWFSGSVARAVGSSPMSASWNT